MRNKIRKVLVGVFLLSLLGGPVWGQARIATVDLRKVFDNYWKKKQAEAQLKERQTDMQKEDKNLIAEFDRAREEYQTLLNGANEPALSTEERDKRKKAAEEDLVKLKEMQGNLEQFDRQARTTLGEKQRRMRDNILVEIKEVVKAKAKAGNFTFVIDTAAESANNTPVLLYYSGENDLTDDVLKQLNLNAPAETPKPSAETKPAANDKK